MVYGGVYKLIFVGILFVMWVSIFVEIFYLFKFFVEYFFSEYWFFYIFGMGLGGDRGKEEV